MLAIVDSRAPREALRNLEQEFDVVPFASAGLTYEEVSGHPDIFLFQDRNTIVAAQNTPQYILNAIQNTSSKLHISNTASGETLQNSTHFNCCATESFWFHKAGCTAYEIESILCAKNLIKLPQAYARCTTSAISDNCIITSDAGVAKAIVNAHLPVMHVDPSDISLPGFRYGFFGGTNGWNNNKIYFIGNILNHKWGKEVETFLDTHGYETVCLSNGNLYDGGGIFFI